MFKATLKLKSDLRKWADQENREIHKDLAFALSKASYNLMRDARQDLKTGKLALKRLSYFSDQSDPRFKRPRPRKSGRTSMKMARSPLTSLWRGIIYRVDRIKLTAQVGFLGGGGVEWQKRIAEKSADGYQWQYTDRQREYLHKIGIHLRKTTVTGRVPTRGPIENVAAKYENRALKQLRDYFARKRKGERI